jgi:hypothetical protein
MTVRILLSIVLICSVGIHPAQATEYPSVEVADAFLDLRTGPGRGYPKTQIVERGQWVEILLRRTDWVKVRTRKGFEGWAHQDDMAHTLDPDGEQTAISTVGEGDFIHRVWETGFKIGTFSGARTSDVYLGYYFTDNLSLETTIGEAFGTSVDFQFLNLSLTHQPWPQWRYSPYLTLGGGAKTTRFSKTTVQLSDRTDQTVHAGLGVRIYITRHIMARGEYRNTVILTDQEQNEESDEWTIGLSAFF